MSCNLGKKSLSVDVKHPESLEVINKLLDKADVFLANFTQRALSARLSLARRDLAGVAPAVTTWR